MRTKYNASVNIIRDSNRELNYIPTPNAVQVINQIGNDFKKGIRSFNIIGSYGTGKSSFLWALEQSQRNRKKYFNLNLINNPTVDFINIVGEHKSIIEVFGELFDVKSNKDLTQNILSAIYNRYYDLGKKKNPLMFITIDEFGKFLEYASEHKPEKELYFIQQLSEFANNDDHNIVFITTVHQNFDAYAFALSSSQRQEWTKVKGRFKEIAFNEPVEQLLYLASESLKQNNSLKFPAKEIQKTLEIFNKTKAFKINTAYLENIAEKLFPLDIFAASIVTICLQKYGQNERSLFSFLESTDNTGISKFDPSRDSFYNIANVYDYLLHNFYTLLNSPLNPDASAWAAIKSSLERVEGFNKDITNHSKIIKSIGLLNITAANGANLDSTFLINYAKTCLNVPNAERLVDELEKEQIIRYRSYNKRFILFEGTDLNIQTALFEAGNKVSEISDIPTLLNKNVELPTVMAKEHSYRTGTPRLFEYRISEHPINEVPTGEIDGFINLIFNEKLPVSKIINESNNQEEAILYGYYKKTKSIKDLLFEIEKAKKVIEENEEDKIAVKELTAMLIHQQNFLSHKILTSIFTDKAEITWIFKGKEYIVSNKKAFNRLLSTICNTVYHQAPLFNNELVNKHRLSSNIGLAKRNYLKALVNNWNQPELGFDEKFPPEKTIYWSLLKHNGLQLYSDKINHEVQVNKDSTFYPLWKFSEQFLNSAKSERRNILELIEALGKRPFKLKQGLIDFWVPSFLFIKRDDFALFAGNKQIYLPVITDETLELIGKDPDEYQIKAFSIEGVRLNIFNSYRLLIDKNTNEKVSNKLFIDTIKPFVTFYNELPEYTRNTKRLSKEASQIREAIKTSQDPEKTFFDVFPNALGYSIDTLQKSKDELPKYIAKLQKAIKELRTFYDDLVNRFEEFILTDIVADKMTFEEYKEALQNRYKKLKKHLLLPDQKVFMQRLDSALDERKSWLNSIAQAVVGNTLDKLTDEEELILYDKFNSMILELDSLTNISKADFSEDKEDVFGLEISSFLDGVSKKMIRLPKNKKKAVSEIENSLKKHLAKDKILNIAALTNLLKELFKQK